MRNGMVMAPTDPLMMGKKTHCMGGQQKCNGAQKWADQKKLTIKPAMVIHTLVSLTNLNVSVNEIKRWNKVDLKRYLQPGQLVTLYIDITNAP